MCLENALDGDLSVKRMMRASLKEITALREVTLDFYDAWAPKPATGGTMRVHLGGWVAAAADDGVARDLMSAALLYAHEVVIYDPVAAYFEPRRGSLRTFRPVIGVGLNADTSNAKLEQSSGYEYFGADNLEAHRSHLSMAVQRVGELAPLIRAGALIPVPHLKLTLQRQDRIWTGVRHLLNDEEYRRCIDNPVDQPALSGDGGPTVRFLTSSIASTAAPTPGGGRAPASVWRSCARSPRPTAARWRWSPRPAAATLARLALPSVPVEALTT